MFELHTLIRENIQRLKPYSSARSEFTGTAGIFLDANENPFGELNRYPDPDQQELKQKISHLKSVPVENIFVGNGSDEIIDLVFRIFCNPGLDKALIFSPTYGMYVVAAAIHDVTLVDEPLNDSFQLNTATLNEVLGDEHLKVVFICSPNNPTGNCIDDLELILQQFNGIVVVDEAYIDFASRPSFSLSIKQYPNLIVLQTLSKAWGLASARIGIAYADAAIISYFNKVKPPYNVSGLNQEAARKTLMDDALFEKRRKIILEQKTWLEQQLPLLPVVVKIYPSDANFILVETLNAEQVYNELVRHIVIVRNRNHIVRNCIRISVGSPEENDQLIKVLKQIVL